MKHRTGSFLLIALFYISTSFTKTYGESILDQFSGDTVVPRQANTIYIAPFTNMTRKTELTDTVALKLSGLVISDGRLAIVKNINAADTVFESKIISFEKQTVTFNNSGQPDKRRLRVIVSAKFTDSKKQRVIFNDSSIQAFFEFSEITRPIVSEIQAVEILTDNLAKRLFAKIMSGWYTGEMTDIEKGKK
ncbi:MAG: LPS assembly lipoprotein LptE [Leptospirales bacterium]|nr:LPS assembly lipoprotein LptE [Leptospirales bacterium]